MLGFTILICLTIINLTVWPAFGFMFNLTGNAQRCFKDTMKPHQLIAGEYALISKVPDHFVTYIAIDSLGHILSQKEHMTQGRFSFTSELYDTYEICFIAKTLTSEKKVVQTISFTTRTDFELKEQKGIGEADRLKPLEIDLKRLADLSENILNDFVLLRQREEEMFNSNLHINDRFLYYGILSISFLLLLGIWQILYLQRYFKSKKLI